MTKTKIIIQYIIIYILFILGISIVSEWLISKFNYKSRNETYIENYLDNYLDKIKTDLKKEYFFKIKEYMGNNTSYNRNKKENFQNFSPGNYDNYFHSNMAIGEAENDIMNKVNDKLNQDNGLTNSLDQHSMGRKTLGQMYSKVDGWTPEDYPLTHSNLYKKYKKVPREINWQEPARLVIPPKDIYNIDYKYEFEPSKISSQPYNIPGKSGEAPEKYFFASDDKLRHTFLDDKYDPKNYPVKSLDGYSTSYSVFE